MTVKTELDSVKQKLYTEISKSIESFQLETGIEIVSVKYKRNNFADFPKTHFVGFSLYIDVGNES